MAANDYLMRQIEDMARFLGKVLFVKTEETIPLFKFKYQKMLQVSKWVNC